MPASAVAAPPLHATRAGPNTTRLPASNGLPAVLDRVSSPDSSGIHAAACAFEAAVGRHRRAFGHLHQIARHQGAGDHTLERTVGAHAVGEQRHQPRVGIAQVADLCRARISGSGRRAERTRTC